MSLGQAQEITSNIDDPTAGSEEGSSNSPPKQQSNRRERTKRVVACHRCKTRKVRCSGKIPCVRCLQQGVLCEASWTRKSFSRMDLLEFQDLLHHINEDAGSSRHIPEADMGNAVQTLTDAQAVHGQHQRLSHVWSHPSDAGAADPEVAWTPVSGSESLNFEPSTNFPTPSEESLLAFDSPQRSQLLSGSLPTHFAPSGDSPTVYHSPSDSVSVSSYDTSQARQLQTPAFLLLPSEEPVGPSLRDVDEQPGFVCSSTRQIIEECLMLAEGLATGHDELGVLQQSVLRSLDFRIQELRRRGTS